MPAAIASRGEATAIGLAVEPDRAAERPVDAEDGAGELRAARADEAGKAEDFAALHVEIDRLAGIGRGARGLDARSTPRRGGAAGGV